MWGAEPRRREPKARGRTTRGAEVGALLKTILITGAGSGIGHTGAVTRRDGRVALAAAD
jgi:NADP-dependent 3-hydroxy acid dehydrogenase YdfG